MPESDLLDPDTAAEFEDEWNTLSRHVYGVGIGDWPWTGQRLADVFARVRRGLNQNQTSRARGVDVDLPALNPTSGMVD